MGSFNKKFNEYSKDNYIAAEEIQDLAKQYSSQALSGRPGEDNNYFKEWRLNDEKAFWKKFKENYKKGGGEKLGVAGVTGRADREKLINAYNNPQYGAPVKPTEKKEEEYKPKVRDYNMDFSSQAYKMETIDVSAIDEKYNLDRTQKQVDRLASKAKEPGKYKSYLDNLRGSFNETKRVDLNKINKGLSRDIKKNKKQIRRLSKFNPDPFKNKKSKR